MRKGPSSQEEKKTSRAKPPRTRGAEPGEKRAPTRPLVTLQQSVGNRAVQRLLAQRSGQAPSELDDQTAERINQQRGGGQPLDSAVQQQMGASTGEDFSQVKVHTGPEADALNQQLGARAFTTGEDIYFREGAYQPNAGEGQQLLAHELTHVVQQRQGAVSGGPGMTVNAPGDAFEQQADDVARSVTAGQAAPGLQRDTMAEEEEEPGAAAEAEPGAAVEAEPGAAAEEEEVQMQAMEEEEVQMQAEEEEEVQMQEMPEEEEEQA